MLLRNDAVNNTASGATKLLFSNKSILIVCQGLEALPAGRLVNVSAAQGGTLNAPASQGSRGQELFLFFMLLRLCSTFPNVEISISELCPFHLTETNSTAF